MIRRVTSSLSCPKKLAALARETVGGDPFEEPFLNIGEEPFVGEEWPFVDFESVPLWSVEWAEPFE